MERVIDQVFSQQLKACELRRGFIDVVRSCIMLQRCLVQVHLFSFFSSLKAIDFDDSPLLQLPHVRLRGPFSLPALGRSVPKAAPSFQEVPLSRLT